MGLLLALECFINGCAEVLYIIQCIKNTENAHAMLRCFTDKSTDNIIRVMIIAEKILAAEKHLDRGFFQMFFKSIQSFPRILIQKTKTRIKRSSAPCFKSIKADFIQCFQLRQHLTDAHTGSAQRLVCVTKDCFRNFNRLHFCHNQKHSPLIVLLYLTDIT